MEREEGKHKRQSPGPEAGRSAKVVADLPEDAEMRDKLTGFLLDYSVPSGTLFFMDTLPFPTNL